MTTQLPAPASCLRSDIRSSPRALSAAVVASASIENASLSEAQMEPVHWHDQLGHISHKHIQSLVRAGTLARRQQSDPSPPPRSLRVNQTSKARCGSTWKARARARPGEEKQRRSRLRRSAAPGSPGLRTARFRSGSFCALNKWQVVWELRKDQ